MNLHQFFVGRAIVFAVLFVLGLGFLAYKAYVPHAEAPAPAGIGTSTQQDAAIAAPPAFVWQYEEADSRNGDGNPETDVFLEARYRDGSVERKLIDTTHASCAAVPEIEVDSLRGTTNIQCYGAGLGYRFKITKGADAYLVQRQEFEEGSPEYEPPVQAYEVVARFPL
jgi:hypothetical protein